VQRVRGETKDCTFSPRDETLCPSLAIAVWKRHWLPRAITFRLRRVTSVRRQASVAIGLALASLIIPKMALAESQHAYLSDRHHITVGGYAQSSDASLTASREGFDPTAVTLGAIGLDDKDSAWMLE
jgi:hypothetical protein